MKATCLQENLAKGLSIVGRAVATRSTLPMASNILLASDGPRLKLAATNLEIGITTWVGAKVEEEGAVAVPARLLAEFVSSLPAEKIELSLNPRNRTLSLRCGRFEANIRGADPDDFPPLPSVSDEPTTTIDAQTLHDGVAQVVFAAATDDTRPALAGVLVALQDEEMTLAAADGYRLSVRRLKLASPVTEKVDFIVPARAMQEIGRLAADDEEPIEITVAPNRSHVLFHTASVDLVSRLIDANFPNYNQIIPTRYTTRVLLNTADLLKSAKLAFLFARDSANIVKLQFEPGQEELQPGRTTISAAADLGDNASQLDAVMEGNQTHVAFNGRYLMDVLAVVGSGQVALEVTSPSSPGVIKPVGDDGFVHVIMPMHVAK
ncbi:MAG: DNA polymerase III subunit beta [Chloroflexota bacterium]